MSDTPRTDAAEGEAFIQTNGCFDPDNACCAYYFARQLERELTAAQAEIARLKAGGCARDQRTTQFCGEALKLQEENDRLRRALERLVESPDNRSLEDFTPEELEAWANAKAVLENTQ